MSNHPLHMTSANSTTSFIPFCAFDGQLDSGGFTAGNLTFCNSFHPTITPRGELCYTLNMTKVGFFEEALFLIDPNLEKSLHVDQDCHYNHRKSPLKIKQGLGLKGHLAKIHIENGYSAVGITEYIGK